MYEPFFKPLPDLFIALTGFIILSPTFLVVGIALLIANDGKIFFSTIKALCE
jgi:lipopolysaccharide/colanic/teichoic acid biosynthesis glycosyltransferase